MEELLVLLIQGFFELVMFVISVFPVELFMYSWERDEDNRTFLKCFLLLLFGLALGGISVMVFPKSIISQSWLRVATLLLAPMAAGLASKTLAEYVSRKKDDVWPKRHFWYSFSICLGGVIVRFACCAR